MTPEGKCQHMDYPQIRGQSRPRRERFPVAVTQIVGRGKRLAMPP
jgi:hypothetical protein